MSAADDFTDAFDALIKERGPAQALVVITGAFVSLTLGVVRKAGHCVDRDLKIDGGKQRDITIHAPKPAQKGEPTRAKNKSCAPDWPRLKAANTKQPAGGRSDATDERALRPDGPIRARIQAPPP